MIKILANQNCSGHICNRNIIRQKSVLLLGCHIYSGNIYLLDHHSTTNFVSLQSFADDHCSGKTSCKMALHISELVEKNIKPCPLELSSYLEASYICIPSKIEIGILFHRLILFALAKFCRLSLFWEDIMWNGLTYQWVSQEEHKTLPLRTEQLLRGQLHMCPK